MCLCFVFATALKERTFSVQVMTFLRRRNQNRVLFTFALKRFYVKIRLSLKRFLYAQIENILLLRFCFLFISSLFRLTLYCQNLVVRFVICCWLYNSISFLFVFIKCYTIRQWRRRRGEGCVPRGSRRNHASILGLLTFCEQ